jgi:hypothetical protein
MSRRPANTTNSRPCHQCYDDYGASPSRQSLGHVRRAPHSALTSAPPLAHQRHQRRHACHQHAPAHHYRRALPAALRGPQDTVRRACCVLALCRADDCSDCLIASCVNMHRPARLKACSRLAACQGCITSTCLTGGPAVQATVAGAEACSLSLPLKLALPQGDKGNLAQVRL